MIRTEPLVYGEQPWKWGVSTEDECTWYVYYRYYQEHGCYPCYNDRKKRLEGYNNGKTWLDNYKDATPHWFSNEPDIEFKHGDIIVFDGHYGHVTYVELPQDHDHCMISQYNLTEPKQFSNDIFTRGCILYGKPYNTGKPLGLLRGEIVIPVDRNELVDQVYVNEPTLRVRLEPNLDGEYYCNCPKGYFNVLNQSEADGYKWYEIEEGKYIADIGWDGTNGVHFIPANDKILVVKQNKELKKRLDKIKEIADYE